MSRESQTEVASVVPDLAPRSTRTTSVPEAVLVLVVSALIAFPRTGEDAIRGVIWAEDGAVALQGAYQAHHGWGDLLTPYQGYAMVLPRLIASLISYLPVTWHGLAVVGSAVAIQAAVALFGYHVVSSHTGGCLAGWIVALGVAAVPVGPETAGSLVNLQWFLLFAACVAPLWEPRGWVGRAATIALMCATGLSSPFGLIPLAVAGLTWYLHRRHDQLVLLLVAVLSVSVQLVVMATAPPRQIPVELQLNPVLILDGYLRRVLGDGVLGLGRYPDAAASSALVPGLLVGVVLTALAVFVAWERGLSALLVPLLAAALSVVTYAAPVGLSDAVGAMSPMLDGRYSVGPTLLLAFATALLVERAVAGDPSGRTAHPSHRTVSGILAGALVLALAYGAVTSWSQPRTLRHGGPSWSSEVLRGRSACAAREPTAPRRLRIAPPGWAVSVTCRWLLTTR
jgi:hypothetical protein